MTSRYDLRPRHARPTSYYDDCPKKSVQHWTQNCVVRKKKTRPVLATRAKKEFNDRMQLLTARCTLHTALLTPEIQDYYRYLHDPGEDHSKPHLCGHYDAFDWARKHVGEEIVCAQCGIYVRCNTITRQMDLFETPLKWLFPKTRSRGKRKVAESVASA